MPDRKKGVSLKERDFTKGAKYLGVSPASLMQFYDLNMNAVLKGMDTGLTNWTVGLQSYQTYADLLHGGAYAADMRDIPYFMVHPSQSRYYAGEYRSQADISNILSDLGAFLASFFGGVNGAAAANEILMDANVPHVFPKLLSDQQYARIVVSFADSLGAGVFRSVASTAVTTLVQASQAMKTQAEAVKEFFPTEEQAAATAKLASLVPALAAAIG